jgi:hypothetical protein
MTKHFVEAKEIIDYADHHSGTVHMPPGNFNPYKIGIELFRDIEDRWNKGKFGKEYEEAENLGEKKRWDRGTGQGREKIFEVRRIYNDVQFIDEFLTPEFIEKHKFYQYGRDPHTGQLRIVSRDPQRHQAHDALPADEPRAPVHLRRRRQLLQPRGAVSRAQAQRPGPRAQIRRRDAEEPLQDLAATVHIQARIDDDMLLFTFAGDQVKQQTIHDELPKPAHQSGSHTVMLHDRSARLRSTVSRSTANRAGFAGEHEYARQSSRWGGSRTSIIARTSLRNRSALKATMHAYGSDLRSQWSGWQITYPTAYRLRRPEIHPPRPMRDVVQPRE